MARKMITYSGSNNFFYISWIISLFFLSIIFLPFFLKIEPFVVGRIHFVTVLATLCNLILWFKLKIIRVCSMQTIIIKLSLTVIFLTVIYSAYLNNLFYSFLFLQMGLFAILTADFFRMYSKLILNGLLYSDKIFYFVGTIIISDLFYEVWQNHPGGLFGHPHFRGSFYLLMIPIFIARIHPKISKVFFSKLINICFCFCVLWLGGIQSSSLAILVLFLVAFSMGLSFYCSRIVTTLLTVVFIFSLVIILFLSHEKILQSFAERFFIWKIIISNANEFGIFGYGLGSFETFYLSEMNRLFLFKPHQLNISNINVEWAHNEWLHLFVELGSFSVVVFSALFIFILNKTYQSFLKRDFIFFIGLSLCLTLVYSFVSFPLHMPCTLLLFSILFLIFISGTYKNRVKPSDCDEDFNLRSCMIVNHFFIVIMVLSMIFGFQRVRSYIQFSNGARLIGTKEASLHFEKSVSAFESKKIVLYNLGKFYLDQKIFYLAEYYFNQLTLIYPGFEAYHGLAVSKDLLNKKEEALDIYLKLKRMRPQNKSLDINIDSLKKRFESQIKAL